MTLYWSKSFEFGSISFELHALSVRCRSSSDSRHVALARVPGFVGWWFVRSSLVCFTSLRICYPLVVFTTDGEWLVDKAWSTKWRQMVFRQPWTIQWSWLGKAASANKKVSVHQHNGYAYNSCKCCRMAWDQESECSRRGERGGDKIQSAGDFNSSMRLIANKIRQSKSRS